MTHSLRARLLAYTVSIIFGVSGGIALYSTAEIRKDLLAKFQRDHEAQARQMAAAVARDLQGRDLDAIDGQVRAAHASPDVLYVHLLDAQGRPLQAAARATAERSLFDRRLVAGGHWLAVWTSNRLRVGGPIDMPDGERVGFIHIGFSLGHIENTIVGLAKATFLAVLFCLLGAVPMAFLLARSISKPLGELAAAAQAIGRGAFDVRVRVGRGDEVGVLAEKINEMAAGLGADFDAVNKAEAEVKRLNVELEARIAARTADLAAANRRFEVERVERRVAEEARSESEARFRRLADGTPAFIWMSGPDKRLFYVNESWLDYTGRTPAHEVGDSWRTLLHPEDANAWFRIYEQSFAARQPFAAEHRLRRSDGEYRWFLTKGTPNLTPSGVLAGYVGSSVDITGLKDSEMALRHAEARQRELVESLKAVVWETETLTWKFSFVSQGAEAMLGYPLARWYEEPHFWVNIIHPEDRGGTLAACQSFTAQGKDHELEYRVIAADGRVVWLRDAIRVIKDKAGRPARRRGVKIDVTNLKHVEGALQESLTGLMFLQDLSQLIVRAEDPKTVLREILSRCVAYGAFDLGTILLLGADGESLMTAAAHGYRGSADAEPRQRGERPQRERRYAPLDDHRTMIVETEEIGSKFMRLKEEGVATALIVPIGAVGGALGFLELGSRRRMKIDAHLVQIAEAIVHQIGVSIQKGRLVEETRKNFARMQALYHINLSVTSSLDLNEVLETLTEKIAEALGYTVAIAIRLVDKASGRLALAATSNVSDEFLAAHDGSKAPNFAAMVAARKETQFIADVQRHSDTMGDKFYRDLGIHSLVGVPLMVSGEVLGTLVVGTRESHEVGQDDIDFIAAIGGHAAMAIHHAWLYGDLRNQAAELKAAREEEARSRADSELLAWVSHEILAAGEDEFWFETVLQKTAVASGFDLGTILLLEYDGHTRKTVASFGYRNPVAADRRSSRAVNGEPSHHEMLEYGYTMVWEDLQHRSRLRRLRAEGARIAITVPIKFSDRPLGVLQLASRARDKIETWEIGLFEAIAEQIAIGVQKAELLGEARRDLQRQEILYDVNLAVTSSLELHEVAKRLSEVLSRRVPNASSTSIRMYDPASDRLTAVGDVNVGGQGDDLYDSLALSVMREPEVLTVIDLESDPRPVARTHFDQSGRRAFLGIKLMFKDDCLGVLSFTMREKPAFSAEDLNLFKLIAGQAAVGLHNAQLYRDIRDQKAAIEKAREIEAAAAAKSRFLAMVSHEIRTPLNAVIGLTEFLLDTELTAEQRKMTETVKKSGEGLLLIINDVLDYSKIEADKLALEEAEFDLRKAMSEVIDIMMPQARNKGLSLTYTYPTNVPDVISGDAGRVRQVLLNLLSNAVKFTDRGEVALRVELAFDKGEEVLLGFKVKDSGIGVPAELQQRLFQPFVQVDSSTTRRFSGTGLGLAICKRLVELMGGSIGLESVEGKGSVFWFTMLTRRGARAIVGKPNRSRTAAATQQKKPNGGYVLVVEDNKANQMVASLLLEKLGYRLDVASNGAEALQAIERTSYDIILMDCDMPQMDGFQATQEIRKRERETGTHIPIIAMTANAMDGDRERCLAAGMDDYVSKPISQEHLKAALDEWP